MNEPDLSRMSMLDLFRMDAEGQIQALVAGLLVLERDSTAAEQLEACMRAAHSLKGAASIVGLDAGVRVAHAMEDCFVAAQRGELTLGHAQIDVLLRGVDLLKRLAATPEAGMAQWSDETHSAELNGFFRALDAVMKAGPPLPDAAQDHSAAAPPASVPAAPAEAPAARTEGAEPAAAGAPPGFVERRSAAASELRETADRMLRVSAEKLDRLMGYAGESLVASHVLKPFADDLLSLKRMQDRALQTFDLVAEALAEGSAGKGSELLEQGLEGLRACHRLLAQRIDDLESIEARSTELAHRLYEAVLDSRMRPFSDGVQAFPRMVRDMARGLGKEVRLEIVGQSVQVDRDILEKLEAPLGHLLRNAIDHGIELPEQRRAAGKPAIGAVRLEARHSAGLLHIVVSDDGAGVDVERLRGAIIERALANEETVRRLSEAELLEFLFLPGFTLKQTVTETSGRGVGLDAVRSMVKQVRGTLRIASQPGAGTRTQLQLPLTLSVVRALVAAVGEEAYAFPLTQIVRALQLPASAVHRLEGRDHFELDGRSVGLVAAHQVLGVASRPNPGDELSVVVIGSEGQRYGIVVDAFLDERELVVQPLDRRLGKVQDIAAGALMDDGAPVLMVDVEDMVHSVQKLVSSGELDRAGRAEPARRRPRKRILVIDDSLTVRELERKILDQAGYDVEVAVDGMDGWNVLRTGRFDLVVTDVDMPRLDGIGLIELIRKDVRLKSLPVMIVSYKDRDEDRRRGLEAGADHYLTKGSFQDESLLQAVVDMIGAAGEALPA